MKFDIPAALKTEHDDLHERLARATKEPGAVGEAAREVARLLHPHFVREEQFAMPPLALLTALATGEVTSDMAPVVALSETLRGELQTMLAEHGAIVAALERMEAAARAANLPQYVRFAGALKLHAQTEEQVLYPAAILVGKYVARSLAQGAK